MKADGLKNHTAHDAMIRARMVKVGSLCSPTLEYIRAWEVELEGWLRETKRIKERLELEQGGMRKYRIYWLDGDEETVAGFGLTDAIKRAGYRKNAMSSVYCFEEV